MIEGMVLLWALFAGLKGAVKAVAGAAAGGARAGGAAAANRTATARQHPNRAVRAVGHTARAAGAVLSGAAKGVAAGARAAKGGAKDGFVSGLAAAEQWRDEAPARRQLKLARREKRAQRREAARDRREQRRQWRAEDREARRARRDARRPKADEAEQPDPASPPDEKPQDQTGQEPPPDPAPADSTPDPHPADPANAQPDDQQPPAGGDMPNQPQVPTGEVQGKADTEKALAAYRGAVTTYQDDAAVLKQEASQCRAMARRLADDLAASELGADTMQTAAGCAEWADILDRAADQLIVECEAVLSVVAEFEGAVAAHDAVEAAAIANQDGGTTEWHADDSRSGGNVNNVK